METVSRIAGVMSFILGIGIMVLIGIIVMEAMSSPFGSTRLDAASIVILLIGAFLLAFSWLLAYILFFWTGWVRKKTGSQLTAFD